MRCFGLHPKPLHAFLRPHIVPMAPTLHSVLDSACPSSSIISRIHSKGLDLPGLWLALLAVSIGLLRWMERPNPSLCLIATRQISELRDDFNWSSLQKGKVIDIGGGSGHVSMELARVSFADESLNCDRRLRLHIWAFTQNFPNLEIVVQDISPNMLAQGKTRDMADLNGRVTFMQHNFFEPQPVHDASAYFIRSCFHNQNDEACVKMLKALVPALEECPPGTPVLINDTILPERGSKTRHEEHELRQLDLAMFVILGAKQRTEKEFRALVSAADPRFRVRKFSSRALCSLLLTFDDLGGECSSRGSYGFARDTFRRYPGRGRCDTRHLRTCSATWPNSNLCG